MISRRRFFAGSAFVGFGPLWAAPAAAHKLRATLSTVEGNRVEKLLSVTHMIHIHEAEHGLSGSGRLLKPDLTRLKARAHLALYVSEHFQLATEASADKIELIGAELVGSFVYVYQQLKLSTSPKNLTLNCSIFRDVFADQINNVDVKIGGVTQSLQFKGKDGPKKISVSA